MKLPPNRLKAALAQRRIQLGLWTSLANAYAIEILAGSGYDWLSLDMEHSPNDLASVLAQVQAMGAYEVEPVVRLVRFDKDLVKQYLDLGVRTLVLPNVDSAEQAREIVAATRYPARGIRGVSGQQRANRWGRVKDYVYEADRELCVLAQIESGDGVKHSGEIAAVDGIDGVFVGPNDLAASLGLLGRSGDTAVQEAISEVVSKVSAARKASGILAPDENDAIRYIGEGYTMLGIGTDQGLLARASDSLVQRVRERMPQRTS